MKFIFIISLAILILTATQPVLAGTNANIVISDITPTNLAPGETREITLTVKNDGSRDARHITLNFQSSEYISVIGTSTIYINSINAWCDTSIKIMVRVEDGIDPGAYSIPITASFDEYYYTATTGYVTSAMTPTTLTIVFDVEGEILLDVADISTSPLELREDSENNNITVLVENAGSKDAKSVTVTIDPASPFLEAYSGSRTDFTEVIASRSSHSFSFALDVVDGAAAGVYSIPLTIDYIDDEYNPFRINTTINLRISPQADFKVGTPTTSPPVITKGTTFRMNLPIENTGNKDAESVKAILKTKSYFTGAKTDYLGDIAIGEVKIATFELEADRDTIPDNYETDIKIIWTDGDDRIEMTKSFALVVASGEDVTETSGLSLLITAAAIIIALGAVLFALSRKKK
ncbi:MAG: secreted protein containing APHP domain protein [Candidatus Syntrophoarchaeum caldarius]|uniref:Secreted protein containing APHP domain protein n=1 Tax=Candidatus Syntropharchaeum caldarium TaxID=1838285 RepID=A0A1F2P8F3_9EURY|nr:MAG: secreted protein containing APHP domain protein [Candidatus Syntrophoarchaeum caldarius]